MCWLKRIKKCFESTIWSFEKFTLPVLTTVRVKLNWNENNKRSIATKEKHGKRMFLFRTLVRKQMDNLQQ